MGKITVALDKAGVVAHIAKMQDFDIPRHKRITYDGLKDVKRVVIAGIRGDMAPCGCVSIVQRDGRFGAVVDGAAG
jgi:hypothetical protein